MLTTSQLYFFPLYVPTRVCLALIALFPVGMRLPFRAGGAAVASTAASERTTSLTPCAEECKSGATSPRKRPFPPASFVEASCPTGLSAACAATAWVES